MREYLLSRRTVLTRDLVSYWRLDAPTGLTRYDAYGSNHLLDNAGNVAQATGRISKCASWDFVAGKYLKIAHNSSLSLGGDIPFTIAGWIQIADKLSNRNLIAKDKSGSREFTVLYVQAIDRYRMLVTTDGTTTVTAAANSFGSPAVNQWHFIMCRHDPYRDVIGISVNAGPIDTTAFAGGVFAGSSNFEIGRGFETDSFRNWGLIDAVGLWKRVLSTEEEAYLYNGGNGREYPWVLR